MDAASGGQVALDLTSLARWGGAYVLLNLGYTDSENPTDPGEPPAQVVRSSSHLTWKRGASEVSRVVSNRWDSAEALAKNAALDWAAASGVTRGTTVHWGWSPRVRGTYALRWPAYSPIARSAASLRWAPLGAELARMSCAWGSSLRLAAGSLLPWAGGQHAGRKLELEWVGATSLHGRSMSMPWRHPPLAARKFRLPWAPARPVPWRITPGLEPGPDPDPVPVTLGNFVHLNLGCPRSELRGFAPLNLGSNACYVIRPQRRTYIVINSAAVVRLPDRRPIEVSRLSIVASVDAWGCSFDLELSDAAQAPLLMPKSSGPTQIEILLNGYQWTALVESHARRREWGNAGVTISGRSRTALLAAPYAPARTKVIDEERSIAQLVSEELSDTGCEATYSSVDWIVPPGAFFYDDAPALDAVALLAGASGAVVQSHSSRMELQVRPRYPVSPWLWRDTTPDHILQEDVVVTESVQMRSAPLYNAVVVTGELAGKGVTAKVRKAGESGQLFAPQASSPLISSAAAAAERGRNILSDRGEQALIELSLPLFRAPVRAGEVGRILPLDLVQVMGAEGTWYGLCTAARIEVRAEDAALVVEQIITLERHYTDAD